jgi:hypothetical protein
MPGTLAIYWVTLDQLDGKVTVVLDVDPVLDGQNPSRYLFFLYQDCGFAIKESLFPIGCQVCLFPALPRLYLTLPEISGGHCKIGYVLARHATRLSLIKDQFVFDDASSKPWKIAFFVELAWLPSP